MLNCAIEGRLNDVPMQTDPFFELEYPTQCHGVPEGILNPRGAWAREEEYDAKARQLAGLFRENFKGFESKAGPATLKGGPVY